MVAAMNGIFDLLPCLAPSGENLEVEHLLRRPPLFELDAGGRQSRRQRAIERGLLAIASTDKARNPAKSDASIHIATMRSLTKAATSSSGCPVVQALPPDRNPILQTCRHLPVRDLSGCRDNLVDQLSPPPKRWLGFRLISLVRDARRLAALFEAGTMGKSKKTPSRLLNMLQKLNPAATPLQLKELLSVEMQKDPDHFMRLMFDDLFADFEHETGYRGPAAQEQFNAWLSKPKN
jgi:hypothetical protein